MPPLKSVKTMVDKTIQFISQLVKSQGFTVVALAAILAWSQYKYDRLEDKIHECNRTMVMMYQEDRRELINVLNNAVQIIESIELCGQQ